MLKEQQKDEIEVSYSKNKLLINENAPAKTDNQENPSFHDTSTELLPKDEEIFRKLNIPWLPNELQSTTGSKAFDSEKENLQRTIKQYKHQVEYMQETNDGLIIANKRLREDLEEVNNHYQELIAVSKEALKRKRSTELQFAGLKQTIRNLQQQNVELTRRMTEMEVEQQKARRKDQALEGIALLTEAAKYL